MTDLQPNRMDRSRWFYTFAALTLLVLTFLGFQLFYTKGQAFPGRPLTPPIRTFLIIHGVAMTLWMLLSVVQPMLVGTNNRRVHMALGKLGAVLALGIVVVGYLTAVNAARVNPPDLKLFGLNQKEFLTVPLCVIALFAVFVSLGVWFRRRSELHRPLMFMASLTVISAALGRMPRLNDWYAGTWLEVCLSGFVATVILGALMLAAKSIWEKRVDRPLAIAFGAMTLTFVASSLIAKTPAWVGFATFLMR